MPPKLSTGNHDRDAAGLTYVYPVISRRAGGLSIGVNFNTNNACNWRCIYCQVPELRRGGAPEMDFDLLAEELRDFINDVLHGEFYDRFNIEPGQRVIKDIAISGNGEPTSLDGFERAIRLIGGIAAEMGVFPGGKFVLISNGSLVHQAAVQQGLKELARHNGELWFKLDSATEAGRKIINNTGLSQEKLLEKLKIASDLCNVKLQTCMLHYGDLVWTRSEKQAYLEFLAALPGHGVKLLEIMLYSIARQSFQPEAEHLRKADILEMQEFAAEISALGYLVKVNE